MNRVKQKLARGEVCRGGWIQIGHPAVAEIMAHAGFDWIAIDDEHAIIDFETGGNIFGAIRNSGTVAMVRVRENNELVIRRWLDAGAQGIIVPMIDTAEQARAAVASAQYPPRGRRGFGFCRANQYGAEFPAYVRDANDDLLLIAQIEHIEAVRNIDAILAVEGIDGTFIGPYDLSGSMGLTGQLTHPDVQEAIRATLDASRRHHKAAGVHVTAVAPDQVAQAVEEGFTFIGLSLDCVMLHHACRLMMAESR